MRFGEVEAICGRRRREREAHPPSDPSFLRFFFPSSPLLPLYPHRLSSPLPSAHSHSTVQPRDLRRVDSTTPNLVPTILVRKHTILATVLHIRCLVKADQVIIFDTVGTKDSKLQSGFIAHLTVSFFGSERRTKEGGFGADPIFGFFFVLLLLQTNLRLRNSEVPYEFR